MTAKAKKPLDKQLTKLFKNYIYYTGISKASRGITTAKKKQKSTTKNTDVLSYLYGMKFYFFSESFTKNNPNYNRFLKSIKYLFDKDSRRFENAVTANVKAYLDMQTTRRNKPSTTRQKKFNKFGIDSRQMQLALNTQRTDKKSKADLKID